MININTKIASTVASNKGLVAEDVIYSKPDGMTTVSEIKENQHPSTNPIAKKIQLNTYVGGNVSYPNAIVEQYFVRPTFVGLQKCVGAQNNVWHLPLNNTYSIKFYTPDQYNAEFYNFVYAVPSVLSKSHSSGFKDYTNGVSQGWIDAFKQYASSLPSNTSSTMPNAIPKTFGTRNFSASESIQEKTFTFNFSGSLSGSIGKSSSFSFKFIFHPGSPPTIPNITSNTN